MKFVALFFFFTAKDGHVPQGQKQFEYLPYAAAALQMVAVNGYKGIAQTA